MGGLNSSGEGVPRGWRNVSAVGKYEKGGHGMPCPYTTIQGWLTASNRAETRLLDALMGRRYDCE